MGRCPFRGVRLRGRGFDALIILALSLLISSAEAVAQGLTDIASYPTTSSAPLDVAVGPTGTIFVLKSVPGAPLLLVEQLDRDGNPLGADLSLSGEGGPASTSRIAVGTAGDIFVLTNAPALTERRIVRLTPGQGNVVIAQYPLSPSSATPIDLSRGAGGTLLVLKRVGTGATLLVERRNRSGALLGPDLALASAGTSPESERIAGNDAGEIFVSTRIRNPALTSDPALMRFAVGVTPVPILVFDTTLPTSPTIFDVSVSLDGDLVLLRSGDTGTGSVIERYDRAGTPLSVPYPFANTSSPGGSSIAAGSGNDVFALGASGVVAPDPVLRRLALVQTIAELAEYEDSTFIRPVDLAADDEGNVLVLKSDFSSVLLIERRSREGTLLGPELAIVSPGDSVNPPALAAGSGFDLYVVVQDLVDSMLRRVVRLSELEAPIAIATYSSMTPRPVDVSADAAGNPLILTAETAGLPVAFVERRSRNGVLQGTPVVVPAANTAMRGPRIAGAAAGSAFVLAGDPDDSMASILYHVPAGGPAVPLVDFASDGAGFGVPVPVDVAADENGHALVMLSDQGLQQVTIARYDATGALIEAAGAAPNSGFASGRGALAAGRHFDRFVLAPASAGFRTQLFGLALVDKDEDGVPDDGDFSLESGDLPCTGGTSQTCDDNCPSSPYASKLEYDAYVVV
jgi:hypothetical protein